MNLTIQIRSSFFFYHAIGNYFSFIGRYERKLPTYDANSCSWKEKKQQKSYQILFQRLGTRRSFKK